MQREAGVANCYQGGGPGTPAILQTENVYLLLDLQFEKLSSFYLITVVLYYSYLHHHRFRIIHYHDKGFNFIVITGLSSL